MFELLVNQFLCLRSGFEIRQLLNLNSAMGMRGHRGRMLLYRHELGGRGREVGSKGGLSVDGK